VGYSGKLEIAGVGIQGQPERKGERGALRRYEGAKKEPRIKWLQKILEYERQSGSQKKKIKRNEEHEGIRSFNCNERTEGQQEEKNKGMHKFK
jgi:hypothetical protein